MPVATAKMLGSKMMSSGGKPTSSTRMPVGARADLGLAREGVGLALLVEGHHHHGRAVAAHEPGLAQELRLAFLQRDRVDDALALDAASGPASITSHLEESIMIGTRAMSGSPAIRLRKRDHGGARRRACASSMLMSMTCAPFSTCWRATASACSKSPFEDQPGEGLASR
jgi:hypothetical protein